MLHHVLEVILKCPTPPAHHKVQSHSTCGHVLTSQQCIQEMAEREEEKKEKKRKKKKKDRGKGINEERYMSMHDNVARQLTM